MGESVKVVVSDNDFVGKNWLFTIAFPQYLVAQELRSIAPSLHRHNCFLREQSRQVVSRYAFWATAATAKALDGSRYRWLLGGVREYKVPGLIEWVCP